jgi:hypothetical protein
VVPPGSIEPRLLASRYELLSEAGRGAMGVVYRALDRESGGIVALKALHSTDPDDLYRLKNEFRALAGVVHPHLVRLYEMSVEGDHGFFTMELIEGTRSVLDHVRREAAPETALRRAFGQLASALAFLHEAGWIHRDLKPSNVLVDAKGRLVLLDFGLVRGLGAEQRERTQVGAVVGTLAYMSPEQALGRPLTAASDWYSFGVLLYECLTGRSPFAGASPALLADRARYSIPPADLVEPDCAPDLAELAGALLAPDPERRPDASRVLAALSDGRVQASTTAPRAAPFVGRARELATLRQAFATLRAGGAALATVEGLSGLGKTSLVERFVHELPAQGALVLRARCYPHEIVPFEALDEVVDDLSRYLSSLSPDRLDALLPRDVATLQRLFPVLGRVTRPAAPDGDGVEPHELRRRGFAALRELLGRLADRRPLVIWIDDLQWADADSTPLLRELLRAPDAPPILWLLTFRAEDRATSPLLQALDKLLETVPPERRHGIVLEPLAREECDELIGLLAGAPLSGESLTTLAREAHGSPFLLTELLRRDGVGAAEVSDLDGLIRRRLASLPAEARRLLEALAVAAGPLDRRVALDVAGLDAPDLAVLLERARLMRASASEGRSRLEIYHDQIREVIERQVTPEARVARHGEIAEALERRGSDDAAQLFTHHAGAGHRAVAARYAAQAGEHAARQLAFDQAARFYRAALEADRAEIDAGQTLERLAEALANAGRGPQAAAAFEAAAAEVAPDRAELLRQRAAEQYLVCGLLEEGKRVLVPLLARQGVRYPATSGGAVTATLTQLPRLALRYFGPRSAARDADELRLRVDVCQRTARGLLMVDPARAAYFSVRALSDALRSGDTSQLVHSLCTVGGALAPLGGPAGAWARSMVSRAERIAASVSDPRLDGTVSVSRAQIEFVDGRFSTMLDLCDRGSRILLENCQGVRWDSDVAQMAALRALEELGRIDELRRRLVGLIDDAIEFDDLYAEVTFRLSNAFWRIPRGEISEARQEAREVLERWDRGSFQMQHLYELRIQAFCDVYEGAPEEAWRRVQAAWPQLERSGLLLHRMLKSDALQIRARVALAADAAPERETERAARALAWMKRPDAVAAACMLRAALAERRGQRVPALSLLAQAEALHASASMALHVAYARRRRGELMGGDEGDSLVWEADRALETAGIREPDRWLGVMAPGFTAAAS